MLATSFVSFFEKHDLLHRSRVFLAAVSGGMDSVVLCELCHRSGLLFSIAHCHFGLRGEESERDEDFVRKLGEKYGVEVFVKKFDTEKYAAENKLSLQEAARNLRYRWFEQLRKEKNISHTLLAHHANDNVETVLMHFFRGTGLEGLTGMPVYKPEGRCLRPLLSCTRKQIEAFATENGLTWVEDSSNRSDKYTRNFFRNELLPAIKKVFPQAEENILSNIERLTGVNNLYRASVEKLKEQVCERAGNEVRIPFRKLMQYRHTSLLFEIIRDYGFSHKGVNELIKLAGSDSGKYIESEDYRIIKHRNHFIVAPKTPAAADTVLIREEDEKVRLPGGVISVAFLNAENVSLNKSAAVAQLDAKEVVFPLLVRRWRRGDYFYPLGLRKKKKLARFFIDQKLSTTEKEAIWVVESAQRIVWVVGLRIDERFKLTGNTKTVLQLRWEAAQPK